MKALLMFFIMAAMLCGVAACANDAVDEDFALPQETIMPLQDYIGTWHTVDIPPNDLVISEINDSEIHFYLGIFRLIGTNGTAVIKDDKIVFSVCANFSGTMEFREDGILLTVEDAGEFSYIRAGQSWDFIIRISHITPPHLKDELDSLLSEDGLPLWAQAAEAFILHSTFVPRDGTSNSLFIANRIGFYDVDGDGIKETIYSTPLNENHFLTHFIGGNGSVFEGDVAEIEFHEVNIDFSSEDARNDFNLRIFEIFREHYA
ncbi:MAG: hypothetical protein FWD48_07955 [Oscillospiraceae bacterium]|nr:hypothetical protein [Oscillospiraceae bacterium]